MINSNLTVLGIKELEQDFTRLSKAMGNKIARDAVAEGARIVVRKAKELVNKDTRKLQKSIYLRRVRQSETPYGATAGLAIRNRGSDTAYYWRFLELGTVRMRAKPFIRTAYDATVNNIEGTVKNKLAQGIDNAIVKGY